MASRSFLSCKILLIILVCFCPTFSLAADTLYQGGEALRFSSRLVSKNKLFTLEFVRLGSAESNASYLGICYQNDSGHPIWIANRDKPIADNSGVLEIDGDSGTMKVTYSGGDLVDFYSSQSPTSKLTATLEDSGNFVLKDANSRSDRILWQSFDDPTDTFLPGMKLGINHRTGHTRSLTSWMSDLVPAPGAFTLEWERDGQELVIKRRAEIYWRSGPLTSNGSFEAYRLNSRLDYSFLNVSNIDEDYFMFTAARNKLTPPETGFSKWLLQFDGELEEQSNGQTFGGKLCNGNNIEMGCVKWDIEPTCRSRDRYELRACDFLVEGGQPIPNYSASLSISDCKEICWKDCRCAGINIEGVNANNTGCTFWYGNFTKDLSAMKSGERIWIWIVVSVAFVLLMALAGISWYRRRQRLRAEKYLNELMTLDATNDTHELESDGNKGHNLKVYRVATIMAATNSFSAKNKLGQGGFGSVYKGQLPDGREVAVKRLSRTSRQGLVEFKNELVLIAKLQHSNLVKLLGCCVEGEEKMLVYEYMPNKSLDSFIFDQSRRELLDWKKRFKIIEEIAQGLLYLHKYSRLRIIHRDLKASNILLNEDLIPKISDFGLARIFKINELKANTNHIVGTYGYMSPEYAMEGVFSVKSDAYSFGVLVLEIVSGRKNRSLLQIDPPLNLVGYAWELWKEGNQFELLDPTLRDSCSEDQVLRCIHVGLLCVEDNVIDRPTMSDVLSMLTSDAQLPLLKQPAFSCVAYSTDSQSNSSTAERKVEDKAEGSSINYVSMSTMEAR
ncbi:G-type lectin S-receptor serine/threonine-protein kinase [Salix suchowensis]|nr:G-type lectin S-receptor serine/threonine-protein kinase [Salix suchowensis]